VRTEGTIGSEQHHSEEGLARHSDSEGAAYHSISLSHPFIDQYKTSALNYFLDLFPLSIHTLTLRLPEVISSIQTGNTLIQVLTDTKMSDQSRSIGSLLRGANRSAKMVTLTIDKMQRSRSYRHGENITQKTEVIKRRVGTCRERILQATKKFKK